MLNGQSTKGIISYSLTSRRSPSKPFSSQEQLYIHLYAQCQKCPFIIQFTGNCPKCRQIPNANPPSETISILPKLVQVPVRDCSPFVPQILQRQETKTFHFIDEQRMAMSASAAHTRRMSIQFTAGHIFSIFSVWLLRVFAPLHIQGQTSVTASEPPCGEASMRPWPHPKRGGQTNNCELLLSAFSSRGRGAMFFLSNMHACIRSLN